MASALDHLLDLSASPDRFDTPVAELRALQLEAANDRLSQQVGAIPLLKNRAEEAGITRIRQLADIVPLLFAHNTYKTYAEPWLTEGKWDRMSRWLATVSTYEVGEATFGDVEGLDGWIARLEQQGRHLAQSSGTTGKPALLGATEGDVTFSAAGNVHGFSWATGIPAAQDHIFFGLGPRMTISRNEAIRVALVEAFNTTTEPAYQLPVPPITTSSVMAMILLRRRIADGTAAPSEVAEFERLSGERQASMEAAQSDAVDALVKAREHKLLLSAFLPHLYAIALGVRERGYGGSDFAPNALLTGGGLKGVQLPPDFRQVILETFNVAEDRVFHFYSMQELNTTFPKCRSGRYHVPPWVIALPLDAPGEVLLDTEGSAVEGRAAFLDLSIEGRWGGVISGDRITIDHGVCECGHQGPHIGEDIVRYADLEGGDKISCAGTIDAYVRGAA